MELKSVLRFAGLVLSPACACLIITAGCTTESELPLPPGAYVAPPEKPIPLENSALSTDPEVAPAGETAAFPTDSDEQTFTLEDLAAEDAPAEPEPVKKAEDAKTTASEFGKDDIIYTIRKNDTLGGIARRHGMSAATLANYNGLTLKSKIYAGKTLRIPATVKTTSVAKTSAAPADGSVYVVKSGDTLGGIAQKHGVRTADLAAANNLDVRKPILVGQKLVIPAGAGKKAGTAAASSSAAKPAASTKKTAAPAAKSSSKTTAAKTSTTAAKAPAAKTTAAASSSAAAKESAPAGKEEPATAAASSAGQNSADDLLKNIGSESETASSEAAAPAPSADTGSVSVAPAAGEEVFDADNTIEINIEREMTLEETARAFDRSYATVKKLNPNIQPDVRLKAGTAVKIPIF